MKEVVITHDVSDGYQLGEHGAVVYWLDGDLKQIAFRAKGGATIELDDLAELENFLTLLHKVAADIHKKGTLHND